ncbi:MAG: hypothetical protein NZM00_14505 [Anaerolinea sp.]|nr:hypothetical protein [Anaerolinea sp.]
MRQLQVRAPPGPLTSREAWDIVQPIVAGLDPQARLTFITSGLDISHAGRSFTWEFMVHLPARQAQALLSLAPADDAADVDSAPLVLTQRIGPADAGAEHPPALPLPFRDSPEVVAELAASGVDFIAGPTDMKLEGRILATGEAVWLTSYWDEVRSVSW